MMHGRVSAIWKTSSASSRKTQQTVICIHHLLGTSGRENSGNNLTEKIQTIVREIHGGRQFFPVHHSADGGRPAPGLFLKQQDELRKAVDTFRASAFEKIAEIKRLRQLMTPQSGNIARISIARLNLYILQFQIMWVIVIGGSNELRQL
jgi:hypothetical protein